MKKYYFSDGKKRFGPYSLDELRSYDIDERTLIWFKGLEKWRLAKNIPEISTTILQKENSKNEIKFTSNELEKDENLIQDGNKSKNSRIINLGISSIVIVLIASVVIILNWNWFFSEDNRSTIDTNNSLTESNFTNDFHISTIKTFIKAEDERDFDKVYSFFANPLKRYWDLEDVDSIKLRKKYDYAWSLSSYSQNKIDTIIKVTKNTYDLYTIFKHFSLKKQAYITNRSLIRFIFNDKGKINETFNVYISNERYDVVTSRQRKKANTIIEKKVYFNKDWEVTTINKYEYSRIIILNQSGESETLVKDYYKTGELQWEGHLLEIKGFNSNEDKMTGLCIWYYKNGNKKNEAYYSNGELDGLSIEFDNNGTMISKILFKKGELVEIIYPDNHSQKLRSDNSPSSNP